jgi:outer membrane protein assembly factor BamD
MMAGFLANYRYSVGAILCALLAGPFCLSAKAQAVQPQSGSSGQTQPQAQPAQTQAQPDRNQPPQDQSQTKQSQKKQTKQNLAPAKQKKIKAHVVKEKEKKKPGDDTSQSAEPDKVLYERALLDIKKGRYTEGRLTLQALINTYPDSEYLAKAKLGVADSYYKEGGTSNLTQAIDEYKNFIIFFPFLDEAAYAQMQIGMGHLRMMEKADRDSTQAIEAEQEFQTFLLKYPQSPLVPKAEQNLRNVQEVLADGEFRIARFYFLKRDYPASAARLIEVSERYPLYSQSDEALWMLGDVYSRAKQVSRNEDDKNHWADLAGQCYSRIVQNYPLSRVAPAAKSRLKAMGMPVPPADPQAVARMKNEQMYQKQHRQNAVLRLPMGMLKSGPSLAEAAHAGSPNLNPPNDAVSAKDVLQQGAKGPDFNLVNAAREDTEQNASGDTTPVEAVPASPNAAQPGLGVGVQIITPPADSNTPPTGSQPNSQPGASQPAGASSPTPPQPDLAPAVSPSSNSSPTAPPNIPPASNVTAPAATTPATPGESSAPAAPQGSSATTPTAVHGASAGQDPPKTQANGQSEGQKPKADKADPSTESTSKKKKGIKKVIPW